MRRFGLSIILLAVLLMSIGCSADYLNTPIAMSPTPCPTQVPTGSISVTPSVTEAPSVTPTPIVMMTEVPTVSVTPSIDAMIAELREGGANAMASFDADGKVVSLPEIIPGEMIYCNNFERALGNYLAPGNVGGEAVSEWSDKLSYSGENCIRVTKRKETTWGICGAGIALDARNGLSYDALVGHVVEVVCRIYYTDEGFGADGEIQFGLYDTYHKERVQVPKRTKSNDIEYDWLGNPIMVWADRYVLCATCPVRKNTWTECRFIVPIEKSSVKDGLLMIGTVEETQNSVGAYVSYYLDDLYITVLE